MTVIQKMDIAAPEGSIGPRVIPTTSEGFPRNNLTSLFLFKETVSAAGFKDQISQSMHPSEGTVAPLSGGGVRMTGLAKVTGPEFNIQARWTIMLGLTQPTPGVTGINGRRTVYSIGPYSVRGMHSWINPNDGEDVSTNGLHSIYTNRAVSGADGQFWPGMPRPWVAQFGKPQSLIIRHHGGGSVSIQQRRAALVQQVSAVWDFNAITGPTGNQAAIMPLNIGSILGFSNGNTIYDCAAIHTLRDLTEAEIGKFHTAHIALAATRGRA